MQDTHDSDKKNCIRLTAVGFNKCLVFTNALKFHERKKEKYDKQLFFSVKIRMLSALVSFLFLFVYLLAHRKTVSSKPKTDTWGSNI